MINVAVNGCTIESVLPISGGNFVIKTQASSTSKVGENGIYSGDIVVSVSNTSFSGLLQDGSVDITIKPTIIKKMKVDNKVVIGEGDTGTSSGVVTFRAGDKTTTSTITIKVSNANQNKVVAA